MLVVLRPSPERGAPPASDETWERYGAERAGSYQAGEIARFGRRARRWCGARTLLLMLARSAWRGAVPDFFIQFVVFVLREA